jgi:hypothetical protein
MPETQILAISVLSKNDEIFLSDFFKDTLFSYAISYVKLITTTSFWQGW